MESRLNNYEAASDAIKALSTLEATVRTLGIDPRLLDLIKLRASQINGCAYCVDMHAAELRKAGETERRMDAHASGAIRLSLPSASVPYWPGPRRSRAFPKLTRPTRITKR